MKKMISTSLLSVAAILFVTDVQAQQAYVGGSAGESFWHVDCAGTTDCSKYHSNYKALLGYSVNSNWAIEASYFSVGEATANIGTVITGVKATGVDLGALYKIDFGNKWGGFAKLGISDNRAEVSAIQTGISSMTSETKKSGVFGGFGATYALTRDTVFRADVDTRHIEVNGTTQTSSGNVYSVNVGLFVAF